LPRRRRSGRLRNDRRTCRRSPESKSKRPGGWNAARASDMKKPGPCNFLVLGSGFEVDRRSGLIVYFHQRVPASMESASFFGPDSMLFSRCCPPSLSPRRRVFCFLVVGSPWKPGDRESRIWGLSARIRTPNYRIWGLRLAREGAKPVRPEAEALAGAHCSRAYTF
jgi:hypothetical protein